MPASSPATYDLIVGVEVVPLLTGRYPGLTLQDRQLHDYGNVYRFSAEDQIPREVSVAIYGTVALATDAFNRRCREVSIGPMEPAPWVGDERRLWWLPNPRAGSILFRRANAVLRVAGMSSPEERAECAQFLDGALQSNDEYVKRAPSVAPPVITKVDLPRKVEPNELHKAPIEVANIEPRDALIVVVGPPLIVKKQPLPVLEYSAPPVPGEERLLFVISSPGNLMSTKEIIVQVGDGGADSEGAMKP